MKISIDENDLFRYVVGNTVIDPIEAQVDFENRYEVFDFVIYDHHRKRFIEQPETFKIFSQQVSKLRSVSKSMDTSFILEECSRLSKSVIDINLS